MRSHMILKKNYSGQNGHFEFYCRQDVASARTKEELPVNVDMNVCTCVFVCAMCVREIERERKVTINKNTFSISTWKFKSPFHS